MGNDDVFMGLENYKPAEESKSAFVKILNALSPEVEELGVPAGALINTKTKKVLAAKGSALTFIPVYYYKDYTVWEDRKLIKRSVDGRIWSDGTTVYQSELVWRGDDTPPIAQEAVNFVIIPSTEFAKEDGSEPEPVILSFATTNFKVGKTFLSLVASKAQGEGIPIFGSVYKIALSLKKNPKGTWYGFDDVEFVKATAPKAAAIAKAECIKSKNLMTTLLIIEAPTQVLIEEKKEQKVVVEAEVVTEKEVAVPTVADDSDDLPF